MFTFFSIPLNYFVRAWRARRPLWLLMKRDLKIRYVGSIGGLFWAVLHPLLQVAIYSLVFSTLFGRQVDDVPFAIWLFCALLPWMLFTETVKGSTTILIRHRNLIQKSGFVAEFSPLVVIGVALVNHCIAFFVLLVILVLCRQPMSYTIWLLPLYLLPLLLFSLGFSLLVAALNVFLRDVGQIVTVILNLWFYLCPILYPLAIIPPHYQKFYHLNPMLFFTEGYRVAILGGTDILWFDVVYALGWTGFLLLLGGSVFRKLKVHFSEVL